MNVGERIRIRREALGMTQEDLALKMGLKGKSSISRIESAGDIISTKNVAKYAKALGTTPAYLMGWADKTSDENIRDEIVYYCQRLNDLGIQKLIERAEELTEIPKYCKD